MPKIEYFEKGGELWFSYREEISIPTKAHSNTWQVFQSSARIPKEIIKEGEEAIKRYAQQKVEKEIKKQKIKAGKQQEFAKNPNCIVSVEYDNEILKGRIVSAEDSTLTVRLEEPYQGETSVHYGWASAISGKYIFEDHKKFSESALKSARELLVNIYKTRQYYERYREVIDLASKLNESQE